MTPALKPPCLRPGDAIRIVSLASPIKEDHLDKGCDELKRLGYAPALDRNAALARQSFFAGPAAARATALRHALEEPSSRAVFCSRGGYGSNYLADELSGLPATPKIFMGASDITSLQIFLWQRFRWVTFYGPMVASNFNHGAGASHGYDSESFCRAVTNTQHGWDIPLQGSALVESQARGTLLGGCLTLIETSLGTPWELDTEGAIFVLEDVSMKPYQIDRSLMHLKQAGKFDAVKGIVLGEFPQCEPPHGGETVQQVAARILSPLKIPILWGAPVGHTDRAMLTLPLGVSAELVSEGAGMLRILEPACAA
jgi:muramoyltetrapeptide carboxypeptidase